MRMCVCNLEREGGLEQRVSNGKIKCVLLQVAKSWVVNKKGDAKIPQKNYQRANRSRDFSTHRQATG